MKLDRSLMTHITADPTAAEVVRHLIGIADAIGFEPTAQGIEQPEQLELRDRREDTWPRTCSSPGWDPSSVIDGSTDGD